MVWHTLCEGVSGEEAARIVADRLREKDRQREEYYRQQKLASSANNGHFLHAQCSEGGACSIRLGGSAFPPDQNKQMRSFLDKPRAIGSSFSFWVSSSKECDRSQLTEDLGQGDSAYFSRIVWPRVLNYFA